MEDHELSEFRKFLDAVRVTDDRTVWLTAVMTVGIAGLRSAMVKNNGIQLACYEFVAKMHELVDTPPPPPIPPTFKKD
jgi:hypothetical protein